MRTFYTWLVSQEYRDDRVGVLASEVMYFPGKKTRRPIMAYVVSIDRGRGLKEAFDEAWAEYLEYRKLMLK
jgi:uncharacterized protein YozE (UPF0346 family)